MSGYQGINLNIDLRSVLRIPKQQRCKTEDRRIRRFYDVKFYPFPRPSDSPPIFAMISSFEVFICAPPRPNTDESIRVLLALRDHEDLPEHIPDLLNSCEWNYVKPEQPLLSFTGATGLIKVVHATSGEEFTTLVGHGVGIVNDLATHPLYPWILASSSMDCSIRIWDLRRTKAAGNNDRNQKPCIIICGHAQSHKEGILTVNWHSGGRYLIAGGYDHQIAIWTIPDLADTSTFWGEIANPRRSAERVRVLHYPHFITGAVHDNYVDHVQFYGDLILSKSLFDHYISLWKVEGFNSHRNPPSDDAAPKTKEYLDTRSGFLPKASRTIHPQHNGVDAPSALEPLWPPTPPPPWQRLLQFEIFDPEQDEPGYIYMRFGLSLPSSTNPKLPPILTFADKQANVLCWDLLALEQGYDSSDLILKASPSSAVEGAATADRVDRSPSRQSDGGNALNRGASGRFSTTPRSKQDSILKFRKIPPAERKRDKYPLHDPFEGIKPHATSKIIGLPTAGAFTGRGIAWSADGRWCVVVGESGDEALATIFERDL